MKKILLFIISLLLLQSCSSSSSDNNSNNNNNAIVSDIDGNVYQTVTICNQTWTKSNLNVSHYRNGDVIPQVTDQTQWDNLTTGAWCYYNNDPATGAVYGKLYNWYAVHDPRGLAPLGWHIPTDLEWTSLSDCLGGGSIAGAAMKETGTNHWISLNSDATNSSGFTALPGGFRYGIPGQTGSIFTFGNIGEGTIWWSSTDAPQYDAITAWSFGIYGGNAARDHDTKRLGVSVRCIKY
jgi:uncharacterized protein (TIGR02145 family)